MIDDVDKANEAQAVLIDAAIAEARRAAAQTWPLPSGWCHWCGEAVSTDRRWCSPECRDQWEMHR